MSDDFIMMRDQTVINAEVARTAYGGKRHDLLVTSNEKKPFKVYGKNDAANAFNYVQNAKKQKDRDIDMSSLQSSQF